MKTGRPSLKKSEKKASVVGVRLKTNDRTRVERAANQSGERLSDWMRRVLVSEADAVLTPAQRDESINVS